MLKPLTMIAALLAAPAAFAGDTSPSTSTSTSMADKNGEMAMKMEGDAPVIHDAYARAATPNARAGAAFMVIMNPTDTDDRLIAVRSDVSARVELHTHVARDDGMMMMREVEGGFVIPAGESHTLARGGDHVMFMGLRESFDQGKEIAVTLVFENAGEIDVVIPVDLARRDGHGMMDHGGAEHGGDS
ncbi:MAG: copper chaperone PCu(A)C [Pseudomonadota bacterium]